MGQGINMSIKNGRDSSGGITITVSDHRCMKDGLVSKFNDITINGGQEASGYFQCDAGVFNGCALSNSSFTLLIKDQGTAHLIGAVSIYENLKAVSNDLLKDSKSNADDEIEVDGGSKKIDKSPVVVIECTTQDDVDGSSDSSVIITVTDYVA